MSGAASRFACRQFAGTGVRSQVMLRNMQDHRYYVFATARERACRPASYRVAHLQRDNLVLVNDFLGQEIRSNSSLVVLAELLVDVAVHEGRLAHAAHHENCRCVPGLTRCTSQDETAHNRLTGKRSIAVNWRPRYKLQQLTSLDPVCWQAGETRSMQLRTHCHRE